MKNAKAKTKSNSVKISNVIPINLMVITRGLRDDMRTCFGAGEAGDPQFTISSKHEHGVCYEVTDEPD